MRREDYSLVSIDVEALKGEKEALLEFLEKKLGAKTKLEEKTLSVDLDEDTLSRGKVKDNINRFLHRNELTDKYKAISDKDGLKIIKKRT